MSVKIPTGEPQPQAYSEDPLFHYTRVFIKFLQLVFASFPKGSYHWSEDEALTDIIIQDQGVTGMDVIEKRPAIIVMRGPAQFGNVSMDQFYGYDPSTGERTHVDLVSSSVTYNCISTQGLEAQRLAWIAKMATRTLKRTLLQAGMHRVGEEISVGAETPPGALVPGDPNQAIMVPVMVPFYFQYRWSVAPLDKVLLKNIDLALTSEATDDVAPRLKQPGMNGRELEIESSTPLTSRMRVASVKTPKPRK